MPARIGPFNPDYAIAPGESLREELEALQMTQAELAERTGLSTKHINPPRMPGDASQGFNWEPAASLMVTRPFQ